MALTKQESEFIGMHIGDGTLYSTGKTTLVWEMRGSTKEKEYYDNHIIKLLRSIFSTDFKPKYRSGGKNGCYGIQTCNKILIGYLLKIGFKPGTKTYTVKVPSLIFNTTKSNKLAFLRGLFDTDGCLYLEPINKNKFYPRIEFGSASPNLIITLKKLLTDLKFRPTTWTSKQYRKGTLCVGYKLRLAGVEQLERWMKEVSTGNSKHLNKYLKFKHYNAAVAQPGTARDC